MIELLLFIVSLLASIIGAVSGIGGGIIIKPVLDATGTMSVSEISFLSGCTVLSMAIVSLINGRNSDVKIERRKNTLLAMGGVIGGVFGRYIFNIVKSGFGSDNMVGAVQAIILFLITIFFFCKLRIRIKYPHIN